MAFSRDFGGGHGGRFGRRIVGHDGFVQVENEGTERQMATFRVWVVGWVPLYSGVDAPLQRLGKLGA